MSGPAEDGFAALADRLGALPVVDRAMMIAQLPVANRLELSQRWAGFAHHGQMEPCGDWRVWLIRAGRGFGKTRAGAEWVSEYARAQSGRADRAGRREQRRCAARDGGGAQRRARRGAQP